MQRRYGLLGEKLSHSYSPELHALFGDYSYELFEIAPRSPGAIRSEEHTSELQSPWN